MPGITIAPCPSARTPPSLGPRDGGLSDVEPDLRRRLREPAPERALEAADHRALAGWPFVELPQDDPAMGAGPRGGVARPEGAGGDRTPSPNTAETGADADHPVANGHTGRTGSVG